MINHKPDKNNNTIPFWGFLEFLKTEGFELSTDQYLNIYKLVERIDFNTSSFEDLKYIISPVISKTPDDQEKFYRAFDTYFTIIENKAGAKKQTPKKKTSNEADKRKAKLKSNKRKKFTLTLLLALIVLVGLGFSYANFIKPNLPTKPIESKINPIIKEIDDLFTKLLQNPGLKAEAKRKIEAARKDFGNNNITKSANEIYYLKRDIDSSETYYNILSLLSSKLDSYMNSKQGNSYAKDISITSPDIEIYLLLTLIISFLLYEYHKSQNQSFIAELEQGKKPPYVWQFNLNHKPKIIWDSELYQVAHHLRKRVIGDELDFDVDRTIQETLNHGGLLELTYKSRSKPSEYIALIDKSSLQSHQASFFSFLATEFSQNDVHIEQFFYQDNMFAFWDELNDKKHYSLEDLIKLFPKHRVLIFGSAHELLDATKGSIKKYVHAMKSWSDIAILTPRHSANWDYKEKILSHHFVVLPANSAGLIELIDTFEGIKSTQLGTWKFDRTNSGIELPEDPILGVKHLSYQLTPEVFKWLCICAVYPQLFWDLTLYLGDVMFSDKSIVTQQNISSLLKISWFNNGFIPLDYRQELMARLDQTTLDSVRKKIVDQMRKNPPKKNTHAYDEYKLNMLVNELLIKDLPNEQKKTIRREIKTMESHVDFSHYTEIKAINPRKNTSTLDFILPEELQNIFKGTGWKPIFARTILFLLTAFVGVYFLSDYIYRVIEDSKQFEAASIIVSSILYGFAFYRFMRRRSILSSFEVAFYWLFLSLGYLYVFVVTKTTILKIFNDVSNDVNSFYDFMILFFILTIILIFNQIKKGIKGPAVAIYHICIAFILFLFVLITLDEVVSGFSSGESLSIAVISVILGSIVFWIIRFIKIKSINRVEIGLYYSIILLIATLYALEEWKDGMLAIIAIFIIAFFVISRKWKLFQFITKSSFSVFWIGICSVLLIYAAEIESVTLVLTTLLLTVGILINKWTKSKTLEYESSIYMIMIVIATIVYLISTNAEDGIIFGVCFALSMLFILISLIIRKHSIHTIELLIFWIGLMMLSVGVLEEFSLNTSIIILANALTAVFFILYKIKAHKKLREAYNLNL